MSSGARLGAQVGGGLGSLAGAVAGGIFEAVFAAVDVVAEITVAAVGGAVVGVAKHLDGPQTPPPKLRDASPPHSTKKQYPRAVATPQRAVSPVCAPQLLQRPNLDEYRETFLSLGPVDGKLSGQKAKEMMIQSGLPSNVLHRVWLLADRDDDQMLTLPEFALAMHFIRMKLSGQDLPPYFPEHMLPVERASLAAFPSSSAQVGTTQLAISAPVAAAQARAQGDPVTAPQLQAARSLHAVQVQAINYCIGCMPGQYQKCRSDIDTVAPGTPISDPFFPDAMLQIVHSGGTLQAKGGEFEPLFLQVLSQMEVMLDGMECRMLRDKLGPCIDMAVVGRYSQNGSAPRPVWVLSRCRLAELDGSAPSSPERIRAVEHMPNGGLRTAQMRWVFQEAEVEDL